jgi:hypothetical protein
MPVKQVTECFYDGLPSVKYPRLRSAGTLTACENLLFPMQYV